MKTRSKKKSNVRLHSREGKMVPKVIFKMRFRDKKKTKKKNPYHWKSVSSKSLFKGKKIVVLSLPGAFTPLCSSNHLPEYDKMYKKLINLGIDDVYCISVNDAFVMHNWGKHLKLKHVKLIPDGNGDFTQKMGALVRKHNLGYGNRSWRYSMYVCDGKIKKIFSENNMQNNDTKDPLKYSNVATMLDYLSSVNS